MPAYGHQAKYYVQAHFEQIESELIMEQQTCNFVQYITEWKHDISQGQRD